jgi:hypothetical protein
MFELADYEVARKKVWAISNLPPLLFPTNTTATRDPGYWLRSNIEITAGL